MRRSMAALNESAGKAGRGAGCPANRAAICSGSRRASSFRASIGRSMEAGDAGYKRFAVAFAIITRVNTTAMVTAKQRTSGDTTVIPMGSHRERLRFAEFTFTRTPSGQCSAEVSVEFENTTYLGRATGQSGPLGDFRVA